MVSVGNSCTEDGDEEEVGRVKGWPHEAEVEEEKEACMTLNDLNAARKTKLLALNRLDFKWLLNMKWAVCKLSSQLSTKR